MSPSTGHNDSCCSLFPLYKKKTDSMLLIIIIIKISSANQTHTSPDHWNKNFILFIFLKKEGRKTDIFSFKEKTNKEEKESFVNQLKKTHTHTQVTDNFEATLAQEDTRSQVALQKNKKQNQYQNFFPLTKLYKMSSYINKKKCSQAGGDEPLILSKRPNDSHKPGSYSVQQHRCFL